MRELPPLAPWLEGLPKDHRGFPVPAEAGWEKGRPVIDKVATDRKVALGMRRACAVCGFLMPQGTTVYRAWAQGDAAHMRQFEREYANDLAGPLHLSCILFSAMACPYLREKQSRLGKASLINPGGRRGTRAAVMGFANFGLLIPAHAHAFLDPAEPPPHFTYIELVDDIPYRDGAELADRYEAAIDADAELIDVTAPRFYWSDTDGDLRSLASSLKKDHGRLVRSQAAYEHVIAGMGRFVAFPM